MSIRNGSNSHEGFEAGYRPHLFGGRAFWVFGKEEWQRGDFGTVSTHLAVVRGLDTF
jgi:hypothetical protein